MTDPLVAVVVLNYNGHEDTRACICSLQQASYPRLLIIVVDNASPKPGLETALQGLPSVEIVRASSNLGFARGNNLGIRHALALGADYVTLLNNDTIVERNCFEPLIAAAESRPRVGAVAGTVLAYTDAPTDKIWYAGGKVSKLRGGESRALLGQRFRIEDFPNVIETKYVTGCFMMLPRFIIETCGALDEDFFFGVEDLELSWRLQKRGFRILYVPGSVIWHRGGRTRPYSGAAVYRLYVSKVLLMRKMLPVACFPCWQFLHRLYMGVWGARRSEHYLISHGYPALVPGSYRSVVLRALRDAGAGGLDTYSVPFDLRNT